MIRISFLLLAAIFGACFGATAQGWERLYSSGGAAALAQTPDGGFLLAGVDEFQWEKPDKAVLLKAGPDGALQWSRRYSIGDTLESFTAVAHTPDGGIVVGGSTTDFGPGFKENHFAFVMKMKANGDIVWTWKLPAEWYDSKVSDLRINSQGHIIAACNPARATAKYVALNLDGQLLWEVAAPNTITRLHLLPDDRIAVTGSTWIRLADAGGQVIWEKNYASKLQIGSFTPLSTGGYALCGATSTPSVGKILRLDVDGNPVWEKTYNPGTYNFWGPIIEAENGNLVMANHSWANFRLLKTDALGNLLWAKAPYPSQLSQAAAPGLIRTAAGDYAFAGMRSNRFLLRYVEPDFSLQTGVVAGSFYHDENDNCTRESNEKALRYFIAQAVDAQGGIYGKTISNDGRYAFELPYGAYEVKIIPRAYDAANWSMCTSHNATIAGADTVKTPSIGARSLADCPILYNYAASGGYKFRPCTTNVVTVKYSNWGTKNATDAKISVDLPEELSFVSANKPVLSQNGQVITFDLGTIEYDTEGSLNFMVNCSCDAVLGSPLCLTAHITPDSCFPATPGWDKSILKISSVCDGTDGVFSIKNIGKGDMSVSREWFLFYLCQPLAAGTVQLAAGEDSTIIVPNVHAYTWMWMQYNALQPFSTAPWTAIKTCANGGVYEPQHFGESAGLPFYDIYCGQVKSSFDPNDIIGIPPGFGAENLILTSQEIMDYAIRFQNTGNDTAYQVVIRDTLPANFDPNTVQPGVSSHPYTWKITNNELVFTFQNILLPDSSTNLEGSQGYVRFRARLRSKQPHGTLLKNRAAIYFDQNAPVLTNTYVHKMTDPILTAAPETGQQHLAMQVAPNPFRDATVFSFSQAVNAHFVLYNAQGQVLREAGINGKQWQLERDNLPAGVYFYKVSAANGRSNTGRLMVQD